MAPHEGSVRSGAVRSKGDGQTKLGQEGWESRRGLQFRRLGYVHHRQIREKPSRTTKIFKSLSPKRKEGAPWPGGKREGGEYLRCTLKVLEI